MAFYCLDVRHCSKTPGTWSLLSDYRVSLEPPLLSLHSPSYDAPPQKRADRVPGAFLLGLAYICRLTPHHGEALNPSEDTGASICFQCSMVGTQKVNAGGSGLTFLEGHHRNSSNKAPMVTLKYKQTPETETKGPQTSWLDILSRPSWFLRVQIHHPNYIYIWNERKHWEFSRRGVLSFFKFFIPGLDVNVWVWGELC